MITLTETEERILITYLELKSVTKTSEKLSYTPTGVRRTLRDLLHRGVVKYASNTYKRTDDPYRVGTMHERDQYKRTLSEKVEMSQEEQEWMMKYYKCRKRGPAAKALNRNRADICLMAIELKIDVDGRWNHAKQA